MQFQIRKIYKLISPFHKMFHQNHPNQVTWRDKKILTESDKFEWNFQVYPDHRSYKINVCK